MSKEEEEDDEEEKARFEEVAHALEVCQAKFEEISDHDFRMYALQWLAQELISDVGTISSAHILSQMVQNTLAHGPDMEMEVSVAKH